MAIWPVPPEASSVAGDAASSTRQRAKVGDVTVLVDEVQAAAPTNKEVTATHLKTRLRTLRRGASITAGVIAYCAPRFQPRRRSADPAHAGPTLKEFAPRLVEDVQRLKSALADRSAKTVNNILMTLSVMLKTAVEWGSIERVPCVIKLLPTPRNAASFHDFEEYERLVETTRSDLQNYLVVLLGGEGGLRCGEIMALEWTDVDLNKRQLFVEGPSENVASEPAGVDAASADRRSAMRR
jgi:integrase